MTCTCVQFVSLQGVRVAQAHVFTAMQLLHLTVHGCGQCKIVLVTSCQSIFNSDIDIVL